MRSQLAEAQSEEERFKLQDVLEEKRKQLFREEMDHMMKT